MVRQRVWDTVVAVVATALVLHLPLPASGGAASVRDHFESILPEEGVLEEVVLRTIDSRNMDPGDTFDRQFDKPGGFAYHCHPHPWMRALVVIEPASPEDEPQTHYVEILEGLPDDPSAWGFWPQELTVQTGDTVHWRNNGTIIHTVTGNMAPVTNLEEADAAVDQQQKAELFVGILSFAAGGAIGLLLLWLLVRRVRQLQP